MPHCHFAPIGPRARSRARSCTWPCDPPRTPVAAVIAVVLLALAVTACVPTRFGRTPPPTLDYVADRVVLQRDFAYLPGATELDPVRLDELDAFVEEIGIRPADEVLVIGHGPLSYQRARRMALELNARGVGDTELRHTDTPRDRVTVAVARTVPIATACLVERHVRFGGSYALLPSPGCANASNLARMMADPADLYGGQALGPAEGAVAGEGVRRYREGTEEGLQVEVTSQ